MGSHSIHPSGDWETDARSLEPRLKVRTLLIRHRSHCWAKHQEQSKKQQEEASERQTCYREPVAGADSPRSPLQQAEP